MGNSAKRTIRDVERAEKRARAIELRREGKTWAEVADVMGYADRSGPKELVDRAIKDVYGKAATEYVGLLLERLEALLSDALEGGKQKKDPHWHEQARKVVGDMRKMLGADRPVTQQIDLSGSVVSQGDLEAKLAGINARKDDE